MVLSTVTLNGNCSNTVTSTSSQNTTTSGHVVTINTSSVTTPVTAGIGINSGITSTSNVTTTSAVVSPTAPHTGYTRRAKLGDSRSTGRLYSAGNTHRSMTRLNIAGIARYIDGTLKMIDRTFFSSFPGGSVGGLHKSMTRLSSSQQINQNGSNTATVNNNSSGECYVTTYFSVS